MCDRALARRAGLALRWRGLPCGLTGLSAGSQAGSLGQRGPSSPAGSTSASRSLTSFLEGLVG
eukprot:3191938-Pyramimonas_sp.AAC.1